ncbi:MAG: flagellar biosynthesis protein FlhA [Pseudomonadaceae bacterium]|nr:flagellar biosynthesis protein FlhA [Pseudomonadaceae bacterium]
MGNFKLGALAIPCLLLLVLALMTIRVPPTVLDVSFTFNIALALVVLLVSVYVMRPLDFAAFPTILLVATLLRLALNVASTRVVLLDGHAGGSAAGKVIESFGEVLVGGNYVVGLVVFIILVIINFVVVTKGAGRISEVSARFTLDAMPGKQMAIDADLNSGVIDQDQARIRREEVAAEADFYGSMDGASKFVKGDAIAGILILLINIVGGLTIGIVQHDLDFGQALEVYTLLTIGDGLVAQLPSLLLSTAAAMIVTRANSSQDMGEQVVNQLFAEPKALAIAAGILFALGIVPGMPHGVFLTLSLAAASIAWWIYQKALQPVADTSAVEEEVADVQPERAEVSWEDVNPVDTLGLEVGYKLIPLVDKNQSGELLSRIRGVRKKLSQELGFLVPTIHIRDNLDLLPNGYRFSLMGVSVGEAEIFVDKFLAIDPGETFGPLSGMATKDPAFGLPAYWIEEHEKDNAQTLGYTVVDASTVVATHVNQIMLDNAADLLGHDEVQHLVDLLAQGSPTLAEQLVPGAISLSGLLKILQNLLREKIPVKDIRTIAQCLADGSASTLSLDDQTNLVRSQLSRMIVQNIYGSEQSLEVITLDPELEQLLLQAKNQGSADAPVIEPVMAERLQQSVVSAAEQQEMAGKPAVLLVSAAIRSLLSRFVRVSQAVIHVLAYEEIPENKQITVVSTIGRTG